jgi:hypothetical protein
MIDWHSVLPKLAARASIRRALDEIGNRAVTSSDIVVGEFINVGHATVTLSDVGISQFADVGHAALFRSATLSTCATPPSVPAQRRGACFSVFCSRVALFGGLLFSFVPFSPRVLFLFLALTHNDNTQYLPGSKSQAGVVPPASTADVRNSFKLAVPRRTRRVGRELVKYCKTHGSPDNPVTKPGWRGRCPDFDQNPKVGCNIYIFCPSCSKFQPKSQYYGRHNPASETGARTNRSQF